MTATCEPPEEHKDKPWHWLRHEVDGATDPKYWADDMEAWDDSGYWRDPENMHAAGWRYVAPAIPPGDEEGV